MRIPNKILISVLIPYPKDQYKVIPAIPEIVYSVYLMEYGIAIYYFTPCNPHEWFFD